MTGEPRIASILLTTAFKDLSVRAAPLACMLAKTYGAKIHVVHVLDSGREVIPTAEGIGLAAPIEPSDAAVSAAHMWLEKFVRQHVAPFHSDVVEAVIYSIPTYEAICSYAREHQIDLIVMGTHGDSMLHRMFHGSVSKAVVEHSPCPVLLVPCPKTTARFEPDLMAAAS